MSQSPALAFVDAIQRRDFAALEALMTPDHVFIDSLGGRIVGRTQMRAGWEGYLRMVPDYAIRIQHWMSDGDTVLLCGEAEGTLATDGKLSPDRHWKVPAAWRAVVRGGLVHEWQVFADNKRMHELLAPLER